jgi:hypothetical protein
MPRQQSHVHAREYWGEFDAGPLCEWLNRKGRPAGDPIEKLIRLNGEIATPLRDVAEEIRSVVGELVRKSTLAVAPVVGDVTTKAWAVSWRLVGNMLPMQGLALVKLLHLADKGLLDRVRQCAWCSRWFYARFEHHRFCTLIRGTKSCEQQSARSSPAWKKKRRDYMQRLRRTKKEQEHGWTKSKRKGKR